MEKKIWNDVKGIRTDKNVIVYILPKVSWNNNIYIHETFSKEVYDRSSDITQEYIQKTKQDLCLMQYVKQYMR